MEFTKDERNSIAEFVFSFQADVLIISDATRLVDVLAAHELLNDKESWRKRITAQDPNVCRELFDIIGQKIPSNKGKEIMDEYYKG